MIELIVAGSEMPALVDDSFGHLVGYLWRLDKGGYVMRKAKGRRIYLHHVVLPGKRYPEFLRDHINRNKLDNRSTNLRWLTFNQSAQNKSPYNRQHRLGLRGVTPFGRRYRATVTVAGTVHRLGYFASAYEAAEAAAALRRELMPFSEDAAA